MKLNESIMKNLKESYDMYNVVIDITSDLFKLKEMIHDGSLKSSEEIIKEIDNILAKAKENANDAW